MGRRERKKPERLATKLREIRIRLGLTQTEMARQVGEDQLTKKDISAFERGTNEPNLSVLLAYSEEANVYLEVLVKDSLDLPAKIPAPRKSEGIPRTPKSPRKSS